LIIKNVQLIHTGNYECQVSNLAGDDQVVYSLQVQSPAKIKIPLPQQSDFIAGTSAILSCRAEGTPEPTISWERNGMSIDSTDSKYQISQSGTLRIRQASPSDNGYYKCTAQNIVGSESTQTYLNIKGMLYKVTINSLHIQFIAPPSIKPTQKYKYQLVEGSSGSIHCHFDGTPQPDITWTLEDKNLADYPNNFYILPSKI
jgi:hemicentin